MNERLKELQTELRTAQQKVRDLVRESVEIIEGMSKEEVAKHYKIDLDMADFAKEFPWEWIDPKW